MKILKNIGKVFIIICFLIFNEYFVDIKIILNNFKIGLIQRYVKNSTGTVLELPFQSKPETLILEDKIRTLHLMNSTRIKIASPILHISLKKMCN